MSNRYQSEKVGLGGAILDTKTGLREWFDYHLEAIEEAARLNEVARSNAKED